MDWWDEWDCLCNDRCPKCNAEIEPDDHEAIEGEKSGAIRTLNDRLRRSMMGGRVVLTSGVYALPPEVKEKVLQAVRSFDAFDNGNDPHKEHDFGNFELGGERYFFKIDYYSTCKAARKIPASLDDGDQRTVRLERGKGSA
jgi:hypothetical protein